MSDSGAQRELCVGLLGTVRGDSGAIKQLYGVKCSRDRLLIYYQPNFCQIPMRNAVSHRNVYIKRIAAAASIRLICRWRVETTLRTNVRTVCQYTRCHFKFSFVNFFFHRDLNRAQPVCNALWTTLKTRTSKRIRLRKNSQYALSNVTTKFRIFGD